jgi:hypothetical protein
VQLQFTKPIPFPLCKNILAALVNQLTGEIHEWTQTSHQTHSSYSYIQPFDEKLESPVATLDIKVSIEEGNPREGYSVLTTLTLTIKKTAETIVISQNNWDEALLSNHRMFSVKANPERVELLRQLLRKELGAESDRSMTAYQMTHQIPAMLTTHPTLARQWLEEALLMGPQQPMWGELLTLAERVLGKIGERLAQRLKESPYDETAWREAEQNPPDGVSKELIRFMVRRFEEWTPTSWLVAEDEGPGLGKGHLPSQLFERMFGFKANVPSPDRFEGYAANYKKISMQRLPSGVLATMRTSSKTVQGEAIHTSYLWGEGFDDCVVLVSKVLTNNGLQLGYAVHITGSEAFQGQAKEALSWFEPFAWREKRPEELFVERTHRTPRCIDREKSEEEQILQMLTLARIDTPEVVQVLKDCHCQKNGCEHIKRLSLSPLHNQLYTKAASSPTESIKRAPLLVAFNAFTHYYLPRRAVPAANKDSFEWLYERARLVVQG